MVNIGEQLLEFTRGRESDDEITKTIQDTYGGELFIIKPELIFDNLELTSLKTKDVKELVQTLKLAGKVLFVTANDAENLYLATRNLGYCAVLMANEINVYDIVNADTLVIEEAAVKYIEEVLK